MREHKCNTLQSRSGNQLPFSSINYGTCTEPEGRMVTKAILNVSIDGLGSKKRTSIFPCGIFQLMDGVNKKKGDPNYDLFRLALKSTAQRLYPNYVNCNFSGQESWVKYDRDNKRDVISKLSDEDKKKLIERLTNSEELCYWLTLKVIDGKIVVNDEQLPIEIASTMGCRTQNGADVNARKCFEENIRSVIDNGYLVSDIYSAAQKDGRGNVAPATIILPTLAMKAKEMFDSGICELGEDVVEIFMSYLDMKISETKDALIERYNYICSKDASCARFMYENRTIAGYVPEEGIVSAMKHGTLAIGQLGLAEALQILIGCDHTTPEGMEVAKRIENLYQTRCAEFKEKYKLNFGVYYTPAENLAFTAMKKFKDKYGEIPNVSDKKFFTNSVHVPVWKEVDPYEKIDIESQLTGYSSAGCITYVEFDSGIKNNINALEDVVLYAMEKDIPYFAVNVPNDMCEDCGYTDEIGECCPVCGSKKISRLRRVTGYLTGNFLTAFNDGKIQEVFMRFTHSKKLKGNK